MQTSTIAQPLTEISFENLDKKFQIRTKYSTRFLNATPTIRFLLHQICDAFKKFRRINFPEIAECKIGALLGINNFFFTHPFQINPATKNQQFAVKTKLGWTLPGICEQVLNCNEIKQRSQLQKPYVFHLPGQRLHKLLEQFWKIASKFTQPQNKILDANNRETLDTLEKTKSHIGERYEI